MPTHRQPEILPPGKGRPAPRFQKAAGLFADENLDLLAHVLDEWFRVPGTSIRFGLDGIMVWCPAWEILSVALLPPSWWLRPGCGVCRTSP